MASDQHQLLVRIAAQKMAADGFAITHWEGRQGLAAGGGRVLLPLPRRLGRHRPDLVGSHTSDGSLGIGEAKTASDLQCERTARQLNEFSVSFNDRGIFGRLYLAIPQSANYLLQELLAKYRLNKRPNIIVLSVPDVLLF